MARYCLDASVVLAWLLKEEYPLVDAFWENITDADTLIAAQLLLPECSAVLHESVGNGRITTEHRHTLLERLLGLDLVPEGSPDQFRHAMEIAIRFRLAKAYDVQYLAAAQISNSELVTIDSGMRQHAIELRLPVRFLR